MKIEKTNNSLVNCLILDYNKIIKLREIILILSCKFNIKKLFI